MFNLKNKIAVITGGGSGIGKAIAIMFAKQGAVVHIIELNADAASEAANEIYSAGISAYFHICNVTSKQEVINVFKSIQGLDILINNAGIAYVGNIENTATEDFEKVFNVNVRGVYNCIYAALPFMKAKGGGVIVNMCSIAAFVGLQERFAYSMSKGAVYAMTLSVAKDYLKDNIRCNSISPARIHTPFVDGFLKKNYPGKETEMFEELSKSQPVGRMGKPEEVAALALFLASEEAGFITGCDYPVDGGFIKLNS